MSCLFITLLLFIFIVCFAFLNMKIRSKITWSSLSEKYPVVKEWPTVFTDRIAFIKLWDANIYLITDDDRIFVCGTRNYDGALGLENIDSVNQPTEIKELAKQKIVEIVCGHHQVFAMGKTIWAWGDLNSLLGIQMYDRSKLLSPQVVFDEETCTKVAVGSVFVLLLTSKGTVYACGKDFYGNRKNLNDLEFALVTIEKPGMIVDISCGFKHALLLSDSGIVFGFGDNKRNALGQASGLHKICEPMIISLPFNIKAQWIASGPNLSAILTIDGRMWLSGGMITDFTEIDLIANFHPVKLFIIGYKYFLGEGDECLLLGMDNQQKWAVIKPENNSQQFCAHRIVPKGLTLAEMVLLEAKRKAVPLMIKIIKTKPMLMNEIDATSQKLSSSLKLKV